MMIFKYVLFIVSILLLQDVYPQETEKSFITKVVYDYDYRIYKNKEERQKERMLLSVAESRSSFMALSRSKLDSVYFISKSKYPTIPMEADWNIDMQKSHQPYRIYIQDSKMTYRRTLNKNIFEDINTFQYVEKLDFSWELINETKELLGYKCFKAVMDYEGKQWISWYSPEISINAGPYKFKNLPGMILEIYDKERDFVFKAISLERDEYDSYDPLVPDKQVTIEKVDKKTFWQQLIAYDKLSIREKFSYGATQKVKINSADGEDISRMVDERPKEKRIYVENLKD